MFLPPLHHLFTFPGCKETGLAAVGCLLDRSSLSLELFLPDKPTMPPTMKMVPSPTRKSKSDCHYWLLRPLPQPRDRWGHRRGFPRDSRDTPLFVDLSDGLNAIGDVIVVPKIKIQTLPTNHLLEGQPNHPCWNLVKLTRASFSTQSFELSCWVTMFWAASWDDDRHSRIE